MPASASEKIFAMPMAVGPVSAARRTVTASAASSAAATRRRGRLGRGFRCLNGRVRRRGRAAGGKSEKERQRKGERGKFLDFHRSGSSAFDISLTV